MQITLENSSSKPLTYRALIRGEGASKFSVVEGSDTITVSILTVQKYTMYRSFFVSQAAHLSMLLPVHLICSLVCISVSICFHEKEN